MNSRGIVPLEQHQYAPFGTLTGVTNIDHNMSRPRFDFYQTDTAVNVSIFVRGLRQEDVSVAFGEHSLSASMTPPMAAGSQTPSAPVQLELQLYDGIDAANCSYAVLNSKVDVLLRKKSPGRKWTTLEAEEGSAIPSYQAATSSSSAIASSTTSSAPAPVPGPASAARPRSKWDKLTFDDDDDDKDTPSSASTATAGTSSGSAQKKKEDPSIEAFFQKLYADADDDTRRAMMKSYTESGGTNLSTNWADVGKKTVSAKPPQGMEERKWT